MRRWPMILLTGIVLAGAELGAGTASADSLQAARKLMVTMDMEEQHRLAVSSLVEMQVKGNAQLQPYRKQMTEFFNKYLSWQNIREDVIKIYAQEFTAEELRELDRFYSTPVGRKAAVKTALVTTRVAALSQQRLQKRLPELYTMIAGDMMKKIKAK